MRRLVEITTEQNKVGLLFAGIVDNNAYSLVTKRQVVGSHNGVGIGHRSVDFLPCGTTVSAWHIALVVSIVEVRSVDHDFLCIDIECRAHSAVMLIPDGSLPYNRIFRYQLYVTIAALCIIHLATRTQ